MSSCHVFPSNCSASALTEVIMPCAAFQLVQIDPCWCHHATSRLPTGPHRPLLTSSSNMSLYISVTPLYGCDISSPKSSTCHVCIVPHRPCGTHFDFLCTRSQKLWLLISSSYGLYFVWSLCHWIHLDELYNLMMVWWRYEILPFYDFRINCYPSGIGIFLDMTIVVSEHDWT